MSKETSGYLVNIVTGAYAGNKGIVYHKEQSKEVQAVKKILVNVVKDFQPVKDEKGQPVKILKNPEHLKLIGFTD
jgi:hypothetical protein